jgi:hypothetical protein
MKCLIDRFTFDIRLTIYSDFVSVNNYFLLTYSARDNRLDGYCYSTFHSIEINEEYLSHYVLSPLSSWEDAYESDSA